MKKENTIKAKRIIAALTITASMSLSVVAQERSGYISSTGRSGYISSTGRTENATTNADGPTLGSGNRSGYLVSTGRTDTIITEDGGGSMGNGNLTTQSESGAFTVIWNWVTGII